MGIQESIRNLFAPQKEESLSMSEMTSLSTKAAVDFLSQIPEISEAFTQADIELALDDRGWLVGGKRMAGELDPLSRQVQVNRARYYWLRDPLAKQAVRLWTDYAFGDTAVTWTCEEDSGVEDRLNKFMNDRRNRRITSRAGMRRMSQRLLVDGEIFFALFDDGTIRYFDCLQITDIICDPDDEDTVKAYKRETAGANNTASKTLYYQPWDSDDETPDVVDPATKKSFTLETKVKIYHLAFDALDKRGNSLFGACSDWSREHRRFMIARVALTQALSRFAYKGTVKGGQKIVDSIRSKMESTFAQTGLSGGTEKNPPNAPGGTWLQNEGINLEAMPRTTGANDAKADADGLKLMVSAGTGIMLHYFGDPSTGNLATATAMELPMLKMFGAYQQFWKDAWRDIFSIVLEEDPDKPLETIAIEMPAIIEDDLAALGTFITQLTTAFPEAKVPEVLQMCLTSMGVQNINDVMGTIEKQKEANDALAAKNAALQAKAIAAKPIGANGNGANNGTPPDGGVAGTNTDTTEAVSEADDLDLLEGWVTINGTHIEIGSDGNIEKGPAALKDAQGSDEHYHGTSEKNVKSILKNGLIAHEPRGAGGKATYVSRSKDLAFSYGTQSGKGNVAVVVVKGEGLEHGTGAFKDVGIAKGGVKPSSISRIEIYRRGAAKGEAPLKVHYPSSSKESYSEAVSQLINKLDELTEALR